MASGMFTRGRLAFLALSSLFGGPPLAAQSVMTGIRAESFTRPTAARFDFGVGAARSRALV